MTDAARRKLEQALGTQVSGLAPLAGGSVANVMAASLADGTRVVAKLGTAASKLDVEGRMLRELRARSDLPVPDVLHAAPDLLVMSHIDNGGGITGSAERDAAHHLAALHGVRDDAFGFPFDTLIGGLHQPNPRTDDWIGFFRDHRLLYMAGTARAAGRLDDGTCARIGKLAADLDRFIPANGTPSLLHGDMWSGNVLTKNGRIAGFVDPACYFGNAEIELAFSTLFGTFSEAFFDEYEKLRPFDRQGFFETRRDLYNLYPLLVHVRLFGGGYVGSVERTLTRFGY